MSQISHSDLFARARNVAVKVLPSTDMSRPPLDARVFGMYVRILRLADGANVLIDKDLPEEALFLGRSLFEESLRLSDLASAGEQRDPLVLGWAQRSLAEYRALWKGAPRWGLTGSVEEAIAACDAEEAALSALAKELRISGKKFRDTLTSAKANNRLDHYWTYQLAHEMVHGSEACFMFSRSRPEQNKVAHRIRTNDPRLKVGVAIFVCHSLLHAATAFAKLFGTEGTNEVGEQLRALTQFEEELSAAGK